MATPPNERATEALAQRTGTRYCATCQTHQPLPGMWRIRPGKVKRWLCSPCGTRSRPVGKPNVF